MTSEHFLLANISTDRNWQKVLWGVSVVCERVACGIHEPHLHSSWTLPQPSLSFSSYQSGLTVMHPDGSAYGEQKADSSPLPLWNTWHILHICWFLEPQSWTPNLILQFLKPNGYLLELARIQLACESSGKVVARLHSWGLWAPKHKQHFAKCTAGPMADTSLNCSSAAVAHQWHQGLGDGKHKHDFETT